MDDRIFELFEKSSGKICDTISENGKRHDDALLRVEARHERALLVVEKRNEELSNKQHISSTKLTVFSLVAAAITFIATMMWNIQANHTDALMHRQAVQASVHIQQQTREMELVKLELQQRYHKESILQDKVRELREKEKRSFALRNKLMITMANVREVIDFGQEQCIHGEYTGKDPVGYREKLLSAVYSLVGVSYEITHVFSVDIHKETIHFISLVDNTKICAKGAATSAQLRTLQENINRLIGASIDNLRQEKVAAESELQIEENAINKILAGESSEKV